MATKTKTDLTAEFAKALGCGAKYVLARLKALGLADTCTRCGGGGHYSYCQMYGTKCFKCGGSGVQMPRLTRKLLASVVEAVAAGKLRPYLDLLALRAEAKKTVDRLLGDYAALTADETAKVDASGLRKHWTIGTRRGFAVRSVAHEFYEAASAAARDLEYAKSDEERVRLAKTVKVMHAAMLESPAMVPESVDGERVIDTLKEPGDDELHIHLRKLALAKVKELRAAI